MTVTHLRPPSLPGARAPLASVQGTLALDLAPRLAPPQPPDPTGPPAIADMKRYVRS